MIGEYFLIHAAAKAIAEEKTEWLVADGRFWG